VLALAASLVAFTALRSLEPANQREQVVRYAADTVGCLDTLHASDTISAMVTLRVLPYDSKDQLPPDFAPFFAQEFKSRFHVPADLPLSVVQLTRAKCRSENDCTGAALWLSANAYLVAQKNGSLSVVEVADESLTPQFAQAVKDILESMGRDLAVPGSREDPLAFVMTIRPHLAPDTVPRERQLFRIRLPWYDLRLTPPAAPPDLALQYPRKAEIVGAEDSVRMSFTVLPNGSVHPGSVDLVSGRYREFIEEVATALDSSTYVPARLGECPVATWTNQSFNFRRRGR
jgi:hypothetical protein